MAGGSPVLSSCIINNKRTIFCSVNNEYLYLDENQDIHCFKFQMHNEYIVNKCILYQCGFDEHRISKLLGNDTEEAPINIFLSFIQGDALTDDSAKENIAVGRKIHSAVLQNI
jgi:hypothetical protein